MIVAMSEPEPGAGTPARVLAVLLPLLVLLALHAFWLEPASLRLGVHHIPAPAGLRDFGPLRIAVISDLHAGAPYIGTDKIDRVVALTNAAKPDLVLLTGDYMVQDVVGGTPMQPEVFVPHLRALRAPLGVFAVLGNHDWWDRAPHIRKVFEANGIPLLDDKQVVLTRGGRRLNLVGLFDFATRTDITETLAAIPKDADSLCFTHSPDVFPLLPRRCALTVAGHTHGGQVWLPIVGRMVVPSKYGQRYAHGLIAEDGKLLFVSSGIGTSIIPVRFHVPPEVSLLIVR
jgi:predicted MPP superfamily phosphohydrolase